MLFAKQRRGTKSDARPLDTSAVSSASLEPKQVANDQVYGEAIWLFSAPIDEIHGCFPRRQALGIVEMGQRKAREESNPKP